MRHQDAYHPRYYSADAVVECLERVKKGQRTKARPVDRWRVCEDAIELLAELLRQEIALAAASRAAIPIVEDGMDAVIGLGNLLRQEDFLLDADAEEILDEFEIIAAVVVDARRAVAAAMAAIGARADIARVDGAVTAPRRSWGDGGFLVRIFPTIAPRS